MFGLCVEYISNSFVGPSFSAYVAEQSDEHSRGRVFGITRGIYMVVTVIGPALAGLLVQRFDFRQMLGVAFVIYLLATLLRIWMATSEHFTQRRSAERLSLTGFKNQMVIMLGMLFSGGILTWIWISDAISDTAFNLTGELFPIYLSKIGGLSVIQIGLLGSAWGIASILGSFLGGWLTDKRSERDILSGGFLLVTIGLVCMVLSRSLGGFLAARLMTGLGIGLLMPAYDSLISKVVAEDKRGLAFGFFGTSLGILSLPMPWIGGQLWERLAPQAPFWVTAILCSITIPIAWRKFVLPKTGEVEAKVVG
jgi:MFS family permease